MPATRTTRCPSCVLTMQRALIAVASCGAEAGGNSSRWGGLGTRRLSPLGEKTGQVWVRTYRPSRAMSSSGTRLLCQEVWNHGEITEPVGQLGVPDLARLSGAAAVIGLRLR